MTTAIDLTPDIEQRLDVLATRTGRTKAFCLHEIIEQGIADMEDYYLAAEVRDRVRKGEEPVFSAAESGLSKIIHKYAAEEWPDECLKLAGRFADFPLREDSPAMLAPDLPRMDF
jgi:RHH-type rel operon transcriptional repressor/antitoxin RelB